MLKKYINNIALFLLALALTTPLYAQIFAVYNVNFILYLIYALGTTLYIIINFKNLKFNSFDILVVLFSLIFISTVFYSLAIDYRRNFLLFLLLPFYYFNGKLIYSTNALKALSKYLVLIIFIICLYIFTQLIENNMIYHKYYHYSDAKLLVDYLTSSQYALTAILLLFSFKIFNINLSRFLILFFFIFIMVSGSRFTIIFTILILPFIFKNWTLRKKIVLGLVVIFGIIYILTTDYLLELMKYLTYSSERLESMIRGDHSINLRYQALDKSLELLNNNILFGYGINSSQLILPLKYAHNMLIETFLESGVINFIILLTILIISLYKVFKLLIKKYPYYWILVIYIYYILSYMKSFTISEGKYLFFMLGFIMTIKYKGK